MTEPVTPENIEASLNEARKLLERGAFKQASLICQGILAIDPKHIGARALTKEIEKRERMLVGSNAVGEEVRLESLRCPSCGASLELQSADSESIVCFSCGAVLSLEGEDPSLVTTLRPDQYPPRSFLKLGLTGTLNGKRCQIIGRVSYDATCREWDAEDNQYYSEPWDYDEWILVDENKKYLYISEDAEGYTVSESFVPSNPSIPNENDTFFSLDKDASPRRISEWMYSTVRHYEGEFTWVPRVGERSGSVEYPFSGTISKSVSWRLAEDNQTKKEIEFFTSAAISKLDLAKAFNLQKIVEEEEQKLAAQKEYRRWSNYYFAAAGILFLLMIYSLLSSGKTVASYEVNLAGIPEQGVVKGPFELTKKGSLHRVVLRASIPDNSSSWAAVELLDAERAAINAVEGDFWRESGYDSDGRWSESSLKQTKYFRLSTPGQYSLRVFTEGARQQSGTRIVRIEVTEGGMLTRWYLFALLLCLGYGYSLRKYHSINPWFVLVGAIVVFAFIISMMSED